MDTVFPMDRYCVVDQKPLADFEKSIYCSEKCREQDSQSLALEQQQQQQQQILSRKHVSTLITYKTVREETISLQESSFGGDRWITDNMGASVGSGSFSGEDDDSVFSFEEYSSSLPSLVSDQESEYEEEESDAEASEIKYEWLYEAPSKGSVKPQREWGYSLELNNSSYSLRDKPVISVLEGTGAGAGSATSKNYQLWLAAH